MSDNFTVYMHIAPNGKRYIGITSKTVMERWNNGNGYRNNRYFFDAICKYGKDNFQHIVIAENLSKEESCELEKSLIKKYDTTNRLYGYNHSTGGDLSAYGVKRSKQYIKKLVQRQRGHTVSQETREKIRKSLEGHPSPKKGTVVSDEIKKKTSIPIICVETGVQYYGINEAQRQTGIKNIGDCLHKRRERAGGFHWEYVV